MVEVSQCSDLADEKGHVQKRSNYVTSICRLFPNQRTSHLLTDGLGTGGLTTGCSNSLQRALSRLGSSHPHPPDAVPVLKGGQTRGYLYPFSRLWGTATDADAQHPTSPVFMHTVLPYHSLHDKCCR